MTWKNRLRLLLGLIGVVALVATLTIGLSHRKGEATTTTATVDAVMYDVGTDYAGAVIEQYVTRGDLVRAGDPVAMIQSNDLARDLADDIIVNSSDVFEVNGDSTLTIKSAVTGVVQEVGVQQGGYAPAGSAVATIAAIETVFVSAEFRLSPEDFARIEQDAPVEITLPNGETIAGIVETVDAATAEGDAIATVGVAISEEEFGQHDGLVTPGTPVSATMKLRNDDVLARLIGGVRTTIGDVREALAL